jgi:hypothetical protein
MVREEAGTAPISKIVDSPESCVIAAVAAAPRFRRQLRVALACRAQHRQRRQETVFGLPKVQLNQPAPSR